MVRRIGSVLRPFMFRWRFLRTRRAQKRWNRYSRSSLVVANDGHSSIRELLRDNERVELEKLLEEIDQFSERFKNEPVQRNR